MTNNTTAQFLTKLKWNTANNTFQKMSRIQIDCYEYRFDPPLNQQIQYGFIEYMETLDIKTEKELVKIAIWLIQHDVEFSMGFRWNRNQPVRYNLKQRKRPKKLYGRIMSCMEEAKTYDLSKA